MSELHLDLDALEHNARLLADRVAARLDLIALEYERGWQGRITQARGIRLARILRGVRTRRRDRLRRVKRRDVARRCEAAL